MISILIIDFNCDIKDINLINYASIQPKRKAIKDSKLFNCLAYYNKYIGVSQLHDCKKQQIMKKANCGGYIFKIISLFMSKSVKYLFNLGYIIIMILMMRLIKEFLRTIFLMHKS